MADGTPSTTRRPRVIDRYLLFDEFASGGMARVHLGRHVGPLGFSRTVAIKRLHVEYARDPDFVAMFLDEARLAARIDHPNVVSTLDVVRTREELFLVMSYVHGDTLSRLVRAAKRQRRIDPAIATAILCDALHGLHAAHEATDTKGEPLCIVHRDVSPQNILVGTDGVARMIDFGIAKATMRTQVTRDGQVKGKLAYMAPEQIRGLPVDRRTDVFAAAVVAWELFTGQRLFDFDDPGATVHHVLNEAIAPPSEARPNLPSELDDVVLRGLARDPDERFATAEVMATALAEACAPAGASAVGQWVHASADEGLAARTKQLSSLEAVDSPMIEDELRAAVGDTGTSELGGVLQDLLARQERSEMPTDVGSVGAVEAPAVGTRPSATPDPISNARPTRRWPMALALAIGVTGAAVGSSVLFSTDPDGQTMVTHSSSSALSSRAPNASASRHEPTATPSTASVADTIASGTMPTASIHTPTVRPPARITPQGTSPPPQRPAASPPSNTTSTSCSPPFYFENGIKRYKRHCFQRN